ncbi:MAG TPA: DNA polymerase III subunit beta [Candidatus Saccharimonadales bacterium]|nr:DNA polymerase III subunit beta [Candidatus Saccharimonadales bacterium]
MKLQVTQENLHKALNSVGRVANSRGTLPILSNILIKTIGNRLSIAATNLDIAITHFIGSKVNNEGAITVPARLMVDFIASLPSGTITLELEDTKLKISAEQYESVINGTNAEEYPVMPAISGGTTWSLPAKTLRSGLQQVLMAASSDESRPVLTGVYVHTHDKKLYLVATDSYRLAEKNLMKSAEETNLLVPANALQDLLRILTDVEDEVSVTHDEQQVLFRVGDVELVARLIEGKYPDYRKLIPASFAHTATLKKQEFINITKVSSLFARESAGSVTIHLDKANQQISIRSIASQLGENTASAAATVEGEGVITLNSRYILDALHAINGEEVRLAFNGKLEACLLSGPKSSDYLHVIMPLKS